MLVNDGGGTSTSILDQLNPLYTAIAQGLGELAGNEAYMDTLEANFPTTISTPDPMKIPQPDNTRMFIADFKVPGTYGFTVQHGYWGTAVPTSESSPSPMDTQNELTKTATQAWHQAYDAYANAGYGGSAAAFRSWGQNVWEPDTEAMSLGVYGLAGLMTWLQDQLAPSAGWVSPDNAAAPTWLANLKRNWPATSHSSDSFYDFWDDVNDKCALYLDAAERLASTSAQTTATISDFQTNLLEVTTKTKEHVELALKQWQTWKAPSGYWGTGKYDDNSTAKTILGDVSYGTGVIAMFPPAALISGSISVVTGGLTYLIPDKTEIMKATTASTAGDIWDGYYDDVDSVCTRMQKALDVVRTQPPKNSDLASGSMGFESFVRMVQADRSDWTPHPVHL
ncbi:MAG: hypothetical protein FWE71_05500 [Nocardioidaceae bacterium]|nr:hypothetical protein [Nocardioidaceae bacterium]MCL2612000.1 hypothetical protein [Nocardioidaceae bacterium]